MSCFPLPATSALASQRVETALSEPRSAGLLSTSRPCVCLRPGECAGSVAAPCHTWRVLSPLFTFRFRVLLHTDISGGCQFSPQCVPFLLRCRGRAVPPAHSWLCLSLHSTFPFGVLGVSACQPDEGSWRPCGGSARPSGAQAEPHWSAFSEKV